MDLTIILTVGKYAILVAIYAFVLVVFRGIIGQLAAESRRARDSAGASADRACVPRRKRRVRPAAAPRAQPAPGPKPEPVPQEPQVAPQPQATPEPEETPGLEEAPGPEEQPAAIPDQARPAPRPTRVDLLAEEPEEIVPAHPEAPPEPELAPVSEPAAPHLLVVESADDDLSAGETIALSAAVTIGRSEENSLQIADRFISSKHALVCLREGRRILVDRGSTNGTFVNGARVDGEVQLSDGDRIALGNTVLEYHGG